MLTENTVPGNADVDWRTFLPRWSGEWADALPDDEVRDADDEAARRSRWLGFPPASEERVAAMEKRLGRRMPPSYRSFLQITDGRRHAGGFVWLLAGTADARWHDNASALADLFEEYLEEDAEPEGRREAGVWRRGLQLDVESDATYVLLGQSTRSLPRQRGQAGVSADAGPALGDPSGGEEPGGRGEDGGGDDGGVQAEGVGERAPGPAHRSGRTSPSR